MSKRKFQTEVNQLLYLIIHSLYSHKEIFLRELISNASDALDKLKYLTLTDDKFKSIKFDPKIEISYLDKDNKLLTVSDCGIGMNKDGLAKNLGTIARSGTKQFLENLTGDSKKDSSLIGQFGVGFYSSFMVADKVEVISRKAGEKEAWIWTSDGKSGYSIDNSVRKTTGTDIVLHLNDEGKEFVNRWEIQNIIKKYSNHIPFPIFLHYEENKYDKKGEVKGKEKKTDQVNAASAFWKRPKRELKKKDYNEFYKTISHDHDNPMMHIHTQAEGTLDYTTLFYIPKTAPIDLFQVDHQPGVKLYVKRVFITEDDKELMPSYLRFVRGVIDSEDLPLNISREILQQNRILAKIKSNSVKKILSELTALTKKKDKYLEFYEQYGRLLKEGAYQDFENRDTLLELLKFKSSKTDDFTSLEEYVDRMKEDQKSIYYITGENEASLRNSPLLEMYNGKDMEVLIMDDPFDEIIIPSLQKYKEKPFKSVHHSDAADDLKTEDSKSDKKDLKPLVKKIKKVLGGQVKDVLVSSRLNESPSCIVADQNDPTAKMQEMFKGMGQSTMPDVKPILEINPEHKIVKKMKSLGKTKTFEDLCWLLYEQAMLIEGIKLPNPATFVTRLNNFLIKSI
ncbi:MAG TPA: molecular chaperone HtpG [Candidatus Marinimicrobia bacterium]|nr:molecular chaperone HtpG [Candidatus Neomarinimicrobiota bacterium]HIO40792.1 molecular chaperone HtpG [Candidatus Neomarinimicrobiota bacterium]